MKIAGTTTQSSTSLATNRSDSIPRRQLHLSRTAKAKTTKFMRLLFSADIKDAFITFSQENKINLKLGADDDPEMTLEKFIALMTKDRVIKLQIGDPKPDNQIRFCAIIESYNSPLPNRLAWFICKLNKENYNIVNKLFKEAYGKSIEEFSP